MGNHRDLCINRAAASRAADLGCPRVGEKTGDPSDGSLSLATDPEVSMHILRLGLAAIVIGLAASGCATVTRGTTESLHIQSEPSGAAVRLSSGQTGTTPCSFELKRKRDVAVEVNKAGFKPVEINVDSKVAGAGAAGMAGNVIIGGVIGIGIDAATGATKSLRPNPVHVHLVALDPAQADALCPQDNPVAAAICHGRLQPGASRDDVLGLLGAPQQRKSDDREWQYGHDTLVFDEAGRFASTIVAR